MISHRKHKHLNQKKNQHNDHKSKKNLLVQQKIMKII